MEMEWQTRRDRIDTRLKALGWHVLPFRPCLPLNTLGPTAITEYETSNGPADYALVLDGKLVGVLEAKRLNTDPQNVLSQAERYARAIEPSPLNFEGLRVPFLWSSNGSEVFHRDCRHPLNLSRKVADYLSPEGIRERLGTDFDRVLVALRSIPNAHPRLRPYQVAANAATEGAMLERRREMLIAMATGTGKTFHECPMSATNSGTCVTPSVTTASGTWTTSSRSRICSS